MKAKIFFLIMLMVINMIVAAETSSEDFDKKLNEFQKSGDVKVFTQGQDTLSVEQQSQVTEAISTSKNFWKNWDTLVENNRNKFWEILDDKNKNNFLTEFSKKYNAEFKGFDSNTHFGKKGIIGNAQVYLDAELVAEYSKNAGENAIKTIEYKKVDEKNLLIITKKNGATAEISVEEGMEGIYFDSKTNTLKRMKKQDDGSLKPDNGVWNGKGKLKVEVNSDGEKISLKSDSESSRKDLANYKTKENSYWPLYSESKDDKGNIVIESKDADISIGKDGKLTHLNNVIIRGNKFGGHFGKDVNVLHDFAEYQKLTPDQKTKSSYLLVDEKLGIIETDVARVEGGLIGSQASQMQDWIKDRKQKLDLITAGIKALETGQDVQDKVKSTFRSLLGNPGAEPDANLFKSLIAKNLGLSEDNFFVKQLSSKNGIETVKSILSYSDKFLTNTDNLMSSLKDNDLAVNNPILRTMIPAEGTQINLQLNKDFAKTIKNVYMSAGSLEIQNNRGDFVPVIDKATPFNYHTDPLLQSKTKAQFSGINLVLRSKGTEIEQWIKSDKYGSLTVEGIGRKNLQTTASQSYYAQGSIYIHGPFGRIGKEISQSDGIMRLELKADSETIEAVNEYMYNSKDTKAYRDMYEKYAELKGKNSLTQEESQILTNLRDELNTQATAINQRRSEMLARGESGFSITGLSQTKPHKFPEAIARGGYALEQIAKGKTPLGKDQPVQFDDPSLMGVKVNAAKSFFNNKEYQGTLANSGIHSIDELETRSLKHIGEIGYFLRTNNGNSIDFIEDSKNGLYQIKYGGKTFNIDPTYGPLIADILPQVVTSVGVDSSNRIYLDNNPWNNRFSKNKETTIAFDLGSYGVVKALRNRKAIKSNAEQYAEKVIRTEIEKKLRIP